MNFFGEETSSGRGKSHLAKQLSTARNDAPPVDEARLFEERFITRVEDCLHPGMHDRALSMFPRFDSSK